MERTTTPATTSAFPSPGERLASIDLLRGLVIVIMALDHVRDFFHAGSLAMNPLDIHQTSVALYLTRWITHFCAPTFVFLAGVSAFLYGRRAGGTAALSRFLFTRGLWLVFLELTVIGFGWDFRPFPGILQVFWALGAAMVVLAALVWLPANAVLAIGIAIACLHNLTDPLVPADFGGFAPAWRLLHAGGPVPLGGGFRLLVFYPLLPWIGVMAAGYGAGRVFLLEPARRRRLLTGAGVAMIAAFLLLRGAHLYGDPRDWQLQAGFLQTLGDFLDVRKYPPSLDYLLATLGPALWLLPRLEGRQGAAAEFLLAFGRVPLFAYVAHLYVAHGAAFLMGVALGIPAAVMAGGLGDPRSLAAAGWGLSLLLTYAVWAMVIMAIYPACRWFAGIKRRRRDWWLSYL